MNNPNHKDFFDSMVGHLSTAAKKTTDFASAQIGLAADRKKLERMKMQEQVRQMEVLQTWNYYKGHYDTVGNAVGRCVSDNHAKLGLNQPRNLENIYCKDTEKNVNIENRQVVFRYEADRRTSDLYNGGLQRVTYPHVPREDIEKELARQLPRYMMKAGYGYASLKVDDSEKDDSVIITLSGVYQGGVVS